MRVITTYERFHRHLTAWTAKDIRTLLVLGPPGRGKSEGIKAALGDRPYHLFKGHDAPLFIYCALHDAPHLPIVINDVGPILTDETHRDLLKGLCETSAREVHWGTTTPKLEGRAHSVVCTGQVLIVANALPTIDPHVEAILDRCDAIRFEPTKLEIINRMHELYPDWAPLIRLLAYLPTLPSIRYLEVVRDWYRSPHLDFVEELLDDCGASPAVAKLAGIMEAFPEHEWCRLYQEQTGYTERSYRSHRDLAKQIVECRKALGPCPNVRLDGLATNPPDPAASGGTRPGHRRPPTCLRIQPAPPDEDEVRPADQDRTA